MGTTTLTVLALIQTVCFCISCVILVCCHQRLFAMWNEMRKELFEFKGWMYRERSVGAESTNFGTRLNDKPIDSENFPGGDKDEKAD